MNITDDEHQYSDVIKTLKGLQKVSAPENFEADLRRRINTEKFEKKKSFWEKLLLPSRLIPSGVLAAIVVILLFVFNTGSGTEDNPLLMPPRIREDVIASTELPPASTQTPSEETSTAKVKNDEVNPSANSFQEDFQSLAANDNAATESEVSNLGITITGGNQPYMPGNVSAVGFSNGIPFNKNSLRYRQRNISPEEKAQLELLKKKMMEKLEELNK